MAAVLGLRLTVVTKNALEVPIKSVTFWSDSQNVMCWVHSQSRSYKPFVANRIGEIHESSSPEQWRYVPTKLNPADVASRGISASDFLNCTIWWNGPSFLQLPEHEWPEKKLDQLHKTDGELKPKKVKTSTEKTFIAVNRSQNGDDRLEPNRYSDWLRLVRTTAWVLRFIENCQYGKNKNLAKELNVDEMKNAETVLIRKA